MGLGGRFHHFFGFFQAQAGEATDNLEDGNLLTRRELLPERRRIRFSLPQAQLQPQPPAGMAPGAIIHHAARQRRQKRQHRKLLQFEKPAQKLLAETET